MNGAILVAGIAALVLAAPAWAADNRQLLRQGAQAPGAGVMRDSSGNRVGTVEQQGGGSRVLLGPGPSHPRLHS